jgi:hypothetical protein
MRRRRLKTFYLTALSWKRIRWKISALVTRKILLYKTQCTIFVDIWSKTAATLTEEKTKGRIKFGSSNLFRLMVVGKILITNAEADQIFLPDSFEQIMF